MPSATPIRGLPYSLGSDLAATIDDTEHSLATALDTVAMDRQGTLAARATRNPSPMAGDYDFATDDATGHPNGTLYRYDGTAWRQVQGYIPDAAVTTAKLAAAAVTTAKLADAAVTAAKIEAQQAWQTLALSGSWTSTSVQYYKDSLGVVHFRGSASASATSYVSATTLATLPVGYRPEVDTWVLLFNHQKNAVLAAIILAADGTVEVGGANWTTSVGDAVKWHTISPFRAA
jgi:hypothetical protein